MLKLFAPGVKVNVSSWRASHVALPLLAHVVYSAWVSVPCVILIYASRYALFLLTLQDCDTWHPFVRPSFLVLSQINDLFIRRLLDVSTGRVNNISVILAQYQIFWWVLNKPAVLQIIYGDKN